MKLDIGGVGVKFEYHVKTKFGSGKWLNCLIKCQVQPITANIIKNYLLHPRKIFYW